MRRAVCKAAREVAEALEGTDLPVFDTRIPLSRRVPSSTLDKRPVVLSAPSSSVAEAYVALADLNAPGALPTAVVRCAERGTGVAVRVGPLRVPQSCATPSNHPSTARS